MAKYALIYVHGFLSSGQARKASLTREYLAQNQPEISFYAPDLPDAPAAAWACLSQLATSLQRSGAKLGFIGGSMGGFFAMYLAPQFKARACLVNPCVDPYSLLPPKPTKMVNSYTKNEFVIDDSYKAILRSIEASHVITPQNLALYLETGDEVLNYKVAQEKFKSLALPVTQIVTGGHHTFDHYAQYLPEMVNFLFSAPVNQALK